MREDENMGARKVGSGDAGDDEGEGRQGYGMVLAVEELDDTGRRMERREGRQDMRPRVVEMRGGRGDEVR